MLEFLTVLGLIVLLVVATVVASVWLVLRRIRRSGLVAAGTRAVAEGVLTLAASRPGSALQRAAALRRLRISRAHRLLRERVTAAQRSGVHLGDIPALLPRLQEEGRRLDGALVRTGGLPAAGSDLIARADRHLAVLAELEAAVGAAAAVPAADDALAREAEEAALGLRLHTAAYTELVAADGPPRAVRPPRAS